jgi:hypothetical protein
MVAGSPLKVPGGEVSPRLLSAEPNLQNIFRLWGDEYWGEKYQGLGLVRVDAEPRSSVPAAKASGIACFFSGAVDSFYTLLKHREEITHLISVHGVDIALEDHSLRAQASRMAREVAKELGKTLVEVETNLRLFSDALVGWKNPRSRAGQCRSSLPASLPQGIDSRHQHVRRAHPLGSTCSRLPVEHGAHGDRA